MFANSPYPGLRPFNRDEADIFFGREAHIDAMVDRLAKHRLLVVTGNSGSGKSSLVRAGLLAALEAGLLATAGAVWRFVICTPRQHPMTELAAALLKFQSSEPSPNDIALRRAELERWPLSLVEEWRRRPMSEGANLLVLVDQFEELFRYQGLSGREEAEIFIELLLASAAQRDVPIYIVLTMRSDFLGRCAEFTDLAEAVSDAQYLCPRLTREQISAAIEGPAKVFGGMVEEMLVARLINDMGTDPDQLPLMQHALMQLWNEAYARDPARPVLRLGDFVAAGGLKGSLSHHADEILGEVVQGDPAREKITRRMFCLLVDGEGETAVRRPVSVTEIMAVADCSLSEITAVADAFRGIGRSFLNPGPNRVLDFDTALDISHECLIRQWRVLREWLSAEAASAEQYLETERRARRWALGRPVWTLWDPPDLDLALAWRDREYPNGAWAKRYGEDFDLVTRFLDESREWRDAAEDERRRRLVAADEAVALQRAEAEAESKRIALDDAIVLGKRPTFLAWLWSPWPQTGRDGLDPTIYAYILHYSLREQIYLVIVTLLSFPFLYYSLDLPKLIVNCTISEKDLPAHFLGMEFNQIPYLIVLCSIFLALVLINGWFKLHINVKKGQVGERMLRRLRYQLYERVLRFPLSHFDRTATGQVIAMMTGELEPVGGFIGEAFALPISQAGTLLTIFIFMFVQDPILGAAAIAFFPLQGYLIPKMQRIIRRLGRERVRKVRVLSDRIAETIAARTEIRANDAAAYQLADMSHRLGEIYDIRFEIYNRKFFIKFLSNMIDNLTPFLFFLIGGYFVIKGELSFGALVAVLVAYKDIPSPWKELLDFYQNEQDVAIKYEQVIEQFQPPGMIDIRLQERSETVPPLTGEIAVDNLSFIRDERALILNGISFTMPLHEHVAIIGQGGSGKNELALLLAGLLRPTSGRITIGGIDLASAPTAVTGRRIGYVGGTPYLFAGTLRDNLLVGLRTRPIRPSEYEPAAAKRRSIQLREARKSGNSEFDVAADWIDYQQAGVADAKELDARIIGVLRIVDLEEDVRLLGLRGRLDPEHQPEAVQRILEARRVLARRLAEGDMAHLVERFDLNRYNANSPVSVNLLFGTPIGPVFDGDGLARHPYVQNVLDEVGLTHNLIEVGARVARVMIEQFTGLRPEHQFFDEFGFIPADEIPVFEGILNRMEMAGIESLLKPPRERLLSLAFKLVAARDPLDLIDEKLQQRILQARRAFAEGLPEALRGSVEFFDLERYNAAAPIQDNILLGKIASGEPDAPVRVSSMLAGVIDALLLRQTVIDIGLGNDIGAGGSRLSLGERQKVWIACAVLKRPDLLILNEATSALHARSQSRVIKQLNEEFAGRGIIWVLHQASLPRNFDRVLVLGNGKLQERGASSELDGSSSLTSLPIAAA
jgi:ABC-type multidrug transport system fused ATPase/permease subunit